MRRVSLTLSRSHQISALLAMCLLIRFFFIFTCRESESVKSYKNQLCDKSPLSPLVMKMYKLKPLTAFFPSGIAHHSSKIELDATFLVPDDLCFYLRQHVIYRVALNFCGSLICEWAAFCVLRKLIFAIGIYFSDCQKVAFYLES